MVKYRYCINLVGNKKAICYNILRKKINKQRRNRWLKILWETLDSIEEAISKVLKPFWELVELVWSLLGDNWLTNGVSAFLKQREGLI